MLYCRNICILKMMNTNMKMKEVEHLRINRKSVAAFALIIIGVLMVFGKFLPVLHSLLGYLIGLLFPIALIVLGYYALQSGRRVLGIILSVIGACILFAKLSWIIGPIIGIALVWWGYSMLKNRHHQEQRQNRMF